MLHVHAYWMRMQYVVCRIMLNHPHLASFSYVGRKGERWGGLSSPLDDGPKRIDDIVGWLSRRGMGLKNVSEQNASGAFSTAKYFFRG